MNQKVHFLVIDGEILIDYSGVCLIIGIYINFQFLLHNFLCVLYISTWGGRDFDVLKTWFQFSCCLSDYIMQHILLSLEKLAYWVKI